MNLHLVYWYNLSLRKNENMFKKNKIEKATTKPNKTLSSVHFGVVIVQLINCKCGGIVKKTVKKEFSIFLHQASKTA